MLYKLNLSLKRYLISHEKFKELHQILSEKNIYLFCDEVYKLLEYDIKYRLPYACDVYSNAVSLGVMSKSFGLAGLRIGWIATQNQSILQKLSAFKDYTSICSSAPRFISISIFKKVIFYFSEFLATVALQHKEKILKRNFDIIQENLKKANSFFQKYSKYFEWVQPNSGVIAFPKIKFDLDVEVFCYDLLEKKSVLLLPSNCYGFGKSHFRFGYGRKNFGECLSQLEAYIDEGHLDQLIQKK